MPCSTGHAQEMKVYLNMCAKLSPKCAARSDVHENSLAMVGAAPTRLQGQLLRQNSMQMADHAVADEEDQTWHTKA